MSCEGSLQSKRESELEGESVRWWVVAGCQGNEMQS